MQKGEQRGKAGRPKKGKMKKDGGCVDAVKGKVFSSWSTVFGQQPTVSSPCSLLPFILHASSFPLPLCAFPYFILPFPAAYGNFN